MSGPDFNEFVDDILVRCADQQTGDRVAVCDIGKLCTLSFPDCPPTWVGMVFERLRNLGFGKSRIDSDRPGARLFKINANGIARAAEVRAMRQAQEASTHAFPIPPDRTALSNDGRPAPVIIHNHVNPTFNNTMTSSNSDNASSGAAWLSAWGTWAAVLVAVAAIFVTLILADKI